MHTSERLYSRLHAGARQPLGARRLVWPNFASVPNLSADEGEMNLVDAFSRVSCDLAPRSIYLRNSKLEVNRRR